jgi:group I intron endonuclease
MASCKENALMIGIYKIISPSNRIYIGQSINIDERKRAYINSSRASLGPKIYNSIKKYGWDKHQHEVIEECSLEQLNERETYWKKYHIDQYGWGKMLFCELHDNGGGPRSEETILKMSKPRNFTQNMKKPKSTTQNMKKPKTNQHIQNMIESHKNRNYSYLYKPKLNLNKPIIQYSLDGNYIYEWESQKEASHNLNISYRIINNCLRGISKTSGGYIWKYKTS